MFSMDVPYTPAQEPSMVLAQAASTSASVTPDFILNSCKETEHTQDGSISPFGGIHPAYMLSNYLASVGSNVKPEDIKVTLLSAPQHGKLNGYTYTPTPGYLGDDRASFMAEYKGKHYKIIVTIKVLVAVDENSPTCPSPELIKVNKNKKAISDASPYKLNSFTVNQAHLGQAFMVNTGDRYLSFTVAGQALRPNGLPRK